MLKTLDSLEDQRLEAFWTSARSWGSSKEGAAKLTPLPPCSEWSIGRVVVSSSPILMLRCLVEWGMRRSRRRFEWSTSLVEWVALDRVNWSSRVCCLLCSALDRVNWSSRSAASSISCLDRVNWSSRICCLLYSCLDRVNWSSRMLCCFPPGLIE